MSSVMTLIGLALLGLAVFITLVVLCCLAWHAGAKCAALHLKLRNSNTWLGKILRFGR